MAVTDAWTDPSEGGTLDLDVGDVLTDAVYDGLCSDLLHLGGTAGTRAKTRTVFAAPHAADGTGVSIPDVSTAGALAGARCADAQTNNVYTSLPVPSDFASLVSLKIIIESGGTGNMYYSIATKYAATGQSSTTHTGAVASNAEAVTADVIETISISAAVASLAAGDILSVQFTRSGGDGLDTITGVVTFAGVILEYLTV